MFAHQDDEVAAAARIMLEVRSGSAVFCLYLTDGTGRNATASTRDAESTTALTSIGVFAERIHFIGSRIAIHDGTLVEHLDRALAEVEGAMSGIDAGAVYCLAWEGGHQDHDASQLVAAAFARRRGIERCREVPLYRAGWGPLFRVQSPRGEGWEKRRITLRDAMTIARLSWVYRSQRSSWLALFPGFFAKLMLFRRELSRTIDRSRYRERPHEGTLFYERRFRYPYAKFARNAEGFIGKHLS